MRPVAFDYTAPNTVADAVTALAAAGDEAAVISGGQSLLPAMRLRMAAPSTLVDLRSIDELREIRLDGDTLVIGAMVTHHTVAGDALVAEHAPLLAQAAARVADPQIRHRGTVGGSLAHADPSGDLGPAVIALGGSIEVAGPGGPRSIPVDEFFEDYFTTARADDEIVVAVRIPSRAGWSTAYEKFTVVAQSWAVVAVAVALRIADGAVAEARIGMANMGATPLRAPAAEQALIGASLDAAALRAAAAVAGQGTNPPEDSAGSPDYRRHMAGVLAGRAAVRAAGLAA